MDRSRKPWSFALLLVLVCSGALLSAQDAPFALKVDVALIPIDVAVYDSQGKPAGALTRDDFLLYEDGVLQDIRQFETADTPYHVLLVFDTSGSLQTQFPFMLEAANRFLMNLKSEDQVAIASFDTAVTKLLDWRTRRGPVAQVSVPGRNGGTDFYGALQWTVGELSRMSGRKGVLVFTDGQDYRIIAVPTPASIAYEDQGFRTTLQTVVESQVPFHFVAINTDRNPDPSDSRRNPNTDSFRFRARTRLEEFAERTGGRVVFPTSIEDVATVYEQIAQEIGASYSLAYESTRPVEDGTYRQVDVRLKKPGFRISQSREGYFAKSGSQQPAAVTSAPVRPNTVATPSVQVPVLVTPIAQALLPLPDKTAWRFDWDEVPGVTKYQIVVNAPDATAPIVDVEVRVPRYALARRNVYSPGQSPAGWTWKVRAQTTGGLWGPWSEERPFDVYVSEPVR